MPRKATGGKVGRPKKTESTALTQLQQKFIELVVTNQGKTAAEYARRLGVSRAAISRWWKSPAVQQKGRRANTERIKSKLLARFESEAVATAFDMQQRKEKMNKLENAREIQLRHFVERHWTGPTSLPGRSKPIQSKEQYLRILIEMSHSGKWPLELLEIYSLSE